MTPFKRYFLMFLIGFMSFSEGMGWNTPTLENLSGKDKSTQVDKVQELNSLITRLRTSDTYKNEVQFINFESYTYSFTNVTFLFHEKFGDINSKITTWVISYLHLLQLY